MSKLTVWRSWKIPRGRGASALLARHDKGQLVHVGGLGNGSREFIRQATRGTFDYEEN